MKIIDLHCDTLGEMYDAKLSFDSPVLDITREAVSCYDDYLPVTAVWSRTDYSGEECWRRFLGAADYARAAFPPKMRRVLAVEDARLLCGDITRLCVLARCGVRILTLTWAGENELGGAHDTDTGLTDFGAQVVHECFNAGIVPDVSHSSDRLFRDVAELAAEAGKPFIASHSNSRKVYYHRRNLTDEMYRSVCASGGIVGVSLEPTHLGVNPGIADAVKHIMHYFELSPANVCLGCDFDGRTARLNGLERACSLEKLALALEESGMTPAEVDRVFWLNAEEFLIKNDII